LVALELLDLPERWDLRVIKAIKHAIEQVIARPHLQDIAAVAAEQEYGSKRVFQAPS
jgi:hypothetical protein